MTLLKPETLEDTDSESGQTFSFAQETNSPARTKPQKTEDDIPPLPELGAETLKNVSEIQEDLIVEDAQDKQETKKGILTHLDTMIRGRKLTLDRAILDLMIALSIGTAGAIGDNVALFDKVPWLGIVLEFVSDQGLKWVANEFDEKVRDLVSKVANKDYRTNKPFIGGTANLVSEGIGLGTKALVALGFIPAGAIGDFVNPATVQAVLEFGKYTPIIGAVVERGVNTSDKLIGRVTGLIGEIFGKVEEEKPGFSFDNFSKWWDQKLQEGVVFSPV
ncbi:MAG TPA: hypothetical protein PK957_00825 [Candidatus Dojkabacteria bacterium]|nr:hypothetical protein [Candidatus Dojkabacteria bacterium]